MDDDDLRDMFAGLGAIQIKRMFGGKGIYHNGMITALVVDGELLLKADALSAPEFAAAGSRQWTYESRKGKAATMPYWSIPDSAIDDADELTIWARKAYERPSEPPNSGERCQAPLPIGNSIGYPSVNVRPTQTPRSSFEELGPG